MAVMTNDWLSEMLFHEQSAHAILQPPTDVQLQRLAGWTAGRSGEIGGHGVVNGGGKAKDTVLALLLYSTQASENGRRPETHREQWSAFYPHALIHSAAARPATAATQ